MPRILVLVVVLLAVIIPAPTLAQEDNPAEEIEALALRVHHHNLRTKDFTVWTGGELGDSTVPYKPTWEMGTVLKDWELPGFREQDEAVSWDDLERPTMLNIWASWCHPCVQEFPDLTEIALTPEEHSYDLIFINSFDEPAMAEEFVERQDPKLHFLSDPEGTLSGTVGSQAIPTNILVDEDGTVLAIHIGSYTPAHAAFFEMVAQHPGVGSFDPDDYPDLEPIAELLPVTADNTEPIAPGAQVSGVLDDETFQHAYRFEGNAGDSIMIRMHADNSELEPYIVLLNEAGERLGESTDYAYEPTATIQNITLPEDGTYLVVATRFLEADGMSEGAYTLKLTQR